MPFVRLADKSDLVHMTTEGCFDSMGVFEITSLGMVLKPDTKLAETLTDFLGGTQNVVVIAFCGHGLFAFRLILVF